MLDTILDIKHRQTLKMQTRNAMPLRDFGVVLLYPEYACSDWPESCYVFVRAKNPDDALRKARKKAAKTLGGEDKITLNQLADDFAPMLVLEGHHVGCPISENYV